MSAADTPLAVTEMVARNGVAGNWLWWNGALSGILTVFFFSRLWRRAGQRLGQDVEWSGRLDRQHCLMDRLGDRRAGHERADQHARAGGEVGGRGVLRLVVADAAAAAHEQHADRTKLCHRLPVMTGAEAVNAVWTYESPFAGVAEIKGRLAFYPKRVDAIEVLPA